MFQFIVNDSSWFSWDGIGLPWFHNVLGWRMTAPLEVIYIFFIRSTISWPRERSGLFYHMHPGDLQTCSTGITHWDFGEFLVRGIRGSGTSWIRGSGNSWEFVEFVRIREFVGVRWIRRSSMNSSEFIEFVGILLASRGWRSTDTLHWHDLLTALSRLLTEYIGICRNIWNEVYQDDWQIYRSSPMCFRQQQLHFVGLKGLEIYRHVLLRMFHWQFYQDYWWNI